MAKLTRVPLKPFAGEALEAEVSQFGSVVEGAKLHTLDIATIQGLNSWLAGFSKALISGNRYPSYQEMNGVLKVLSYEQAYALQEGVPEYDSATTYYIGSIVKKTGTFELYGSLTDDNVGQALTDAADWKFLCDLNTIGQNITQIGTCSTASATAEKAVTLGVTSLTDGLTFLVDFDNANTSSTITMNVDALGAKNIVDKLGTQITGTYFSNRANERCLLRYDSTLDSFELLNADFWSVRMGMPSASYIDLTPGVSGTTYTAPTDGYLCGTSENGSLRLGNLTKNFGVNGIAIPGLTGGNAIICASKNDILDYTYNATIDALTFRYAEGAKP